MHLRISALTLLLFGIAAWADDQADRVKLLGAWDSQDESAKVAWTLESKGDKLHITYSQGDQKVAEFECNTKGRDCDSKLAGAKAKVSLWFNGPKLVELETHGAQIVKRRFAVAGQGDQMEVEVIPIAPDGKPETQHFKRAALSSSSH
jgi:hypothetical protein